jgi:hypothetical protein
VISWAIPVKDRVSLAESVGLEGPSDVDLYSCLCACQAMEWVRS